LCRSEAIFDISSISYTMPSAPVRTH
jgi:hypothetical protein